MSNASLRIKINPSYWRHPYNIPFAEDVSPSSLFLRNKHYLIVDVETQNLIQDVGGPQNIHKLRISVACAYDSKTDAFTSYEEHQMGVLTQLCHERLVIGYNIKGFDFLVMQQYGLDIKKCDSFDIMLDIEQQMRQRYIKLDAIARGTLGETKSADGLLAVKWWQEGKMDLIKEYCLQDVKVTRDIFLFGRQHKYVRFQKSADQPSQTITVAWD